MIFKKFQMFAQIFPHFLKIRKNYLKFLKIRANARNFWISRKIERLFCQFFKNLIKRLEFFKKLENVQKTFVISWKIMKNGISVGLDLWILTNFAHILPKKPLFPIIPPTQTPNSHTSLMFVFIVD